MMIIKTFRAESSATALKMVREAMGGDAVVLKTTQVRGENNRSHFEVTACLENPTVDQSNKIFTDTGNDKNIADTAVTNDTIESTLAEIEKEQVVPSANRLEEKELDSNARFKPFETIYERLQEHDFDRSFIGGFMDELTSSYTGDEDPDYFAESKLVAKIAAYFSPEYTCTEGDRIALIGPAGSGKSSVMGKFASNLVIKQKQKIMLVTLDDVKMGAFDETTAYAEILGAEYADSRTSTEEIKQNKGMVTLIDTVAMPVIKENLLPIVEKLNGLETNERIAVISATMRSKDIAAFKEHLVLAGATKLVVTMTDMSVCIGSLVTAAFQTGLPIIYTTDTPGGVGQLHVPDPAQLIREMLQLEAINE